MNRIRNRSFRQYIRIAFFLGLTCSAYAQELYSGLVLGKETKVSEDNAIVLQGEKSIVAFYAGSAQYTQILRTEPSTISFEKGKTYIVSFKYRILETANRGFEALFYSPTAGQKGEWLPSYVFSGMAGDTDVIEYKSSLGQYDDYQFVINIVGKGAIAIDSLLIQSEIGPLTILFEDFEPSPVPLVVQGQFQFALSLPATYKMGSVAMGSMARTFTLRSASARDLDGDGRNEIPITVTTYPMQSFQPIMILGNKGKAEDLTARFFPNGIPRLKHSPYIYFPDLNNDGREDIVFAEAGLDTEPWTGSRIVVALRNANGTFRDVSDLIPKELSETRSYALGVGDINNDGVPDLLLPDQLHGTNYSILSWKNDRFSAKYNWIPDELWRWPVKLYASNCLAVDDIDKDGFADIIAGGGWERPNIRIMYGSRGGFTLNNLKVLPEGPFGHTEWEEWEKSSVCQGTDSNGVLILDLNNDGTKDLFLMEEQVLSFKPGYDKSSKDPVFGHVKNFGGQIYANSAFRVLINTGKRTWQDLNSRSTDHILGWRYYLSLFPMDLNFDGFVDIVGGYWTKKTPSQSGGLFGATFFLNDGTGNFQVVEGPHVLPTSGQWEDPIQNQFGIFLPTYIDESKIQGLFIASKIDGTIIVRTGETNDHFGTGPDFCDSAALGFPGYNEFFYLNKYPDAASAVLAGQFRNGLEHYAKIGIARGYQAFAANATIRGMHGGDVLNLGVRSSDVTIKKTANGWQVHDKSGKYGTLTLTHIATLIFIDAIKNLE